MSDSKVGGSGRTGRAVLIPPDDRPPLDLGDDTAGYTTVKYGTKYFEAWQSSWTPQEREVIARYRAIEGYKEINGVARGQLPPSPETRSTMKQLDAVLRRSQFQRDTILYRGVNTDALQNAKPGDVLRDKGYVSVSMNRWVADIFAHGNVHFLSSDQEPVLMKIIARRGKKGGYIDSFDANQTNGEILLPRNARFRVTQITMLPAAGRKPTRLIEAEYL